MKLRIGFISNSSSSSFLVYGIDNRHLKETFLAAYLKDNHEFTYNSCENVIFNKKNLYLLCCAEFFEDHPFEYQNKKYTLYMAEVLVI